jgi:hypothetical protein
LERLTKRSQTELKKESQEREFKKLRVKEKLTGKTRRNPVTRPKRFSDVNKKEREARSQYKNPKPQKPSVFKKPPKSDETTPRTRRPVT